MGGVVDFLRDRGVPVWAGGEHRNVRHGKYGTDCPRCSPGSGKAKLGWGPGWRSMVCWTCGPIQLAQALRELTDQPWPVIRDVVQDVFDQPWGKEERPTAGAVTTPFAIGPLLPAHRAYLESRRLDPDEVAKLWNVAAVGPWARPWQWRLFLPVTLRGETVSWTTRSIDPNAGHNDRYRGAKPGEEKLNARDLLFGEDFARHAIIVVEGPMDAIRVGPGAVATMGVRTTPAQVARVAAYPMRFVCFDVEPAAQQRAKELMSELSVFAGETRNIVLESAKDPGAASKQEIKELRSLLR